MVKAGVLTISDKGFSGQRADVSGHYIVKTLRTLGMDVSSYEVIPDDVKTIAATLSRWVDEGGVDLIFTTGGTGLAPRDVTPEATRTVIDKEVPGIVDMMRTNGFKMTPTAILSRAVAGVRGQCLIINLPGNPNAVEEYLDLILPILPHAIVTLQGKMGDHD